MFWWCGGCLQASSLSTKERKEKRKQKKCLVLPSIEKWHLKSNPFRTRAEEQANLLSLEQTSTVCSDFGDRAHWGELRRTKWSKCSNFIPLSTHYSIHLASEQCLRMVMLPCFLLFIINLYNLCLPHIMLASLILMLCGAFIFGLCLLFKNQARVLHHMPKIRGSHQTPECGSESHASKSCLHLPLMQCLSFQLGDERPRARNIGWNSNEPVFTF